tara:strand:+ start:229 stop:495 length:267 start_codon:yes stop_codon:yes gene_type:complete
MSLTLVKNTHQYYKFQGERYSRDIKKDNEYLIRAIHEKFNELVYKEVLMTRREESLRRAEHHEKTYNEFIESLKRIRAERELKESQKK